MTRIRAGSRLVALCVLLAGGWSAGGAQAQTCTNVATGNWGTAATWNCTLPAGARVPTTADNVVIINNTTVTVNIAGAVAGSITINGGANATSLTMGGAGTTLAVTNAGGRSGNVVINGPTAAVTKQISIGARSMSVSGSVTITGGTTTNSANNVAQLAVTTGTVSIGGDLVMTAGTATSFARTTLTTGTINVTGNVTLNGGGTNVRDALLSVTGVSAPGAGVNIGGALNINSTVAASSSVTLGTNSRITVAGNVNNGDTLSIGAGVFAMTNAGATLATRNPLIVAVTSVTSGSLTVAGNAVVDPNGVGASTLTVSTGVIAINGNLSVTTVAATNDNGDATASVTNTGRMDIGGNVTVTGGSTALRDALLTVSGASGAGQGINIGGSLTIAATVATSATVSLTNASSRITVNGAGGVTNGDTMSVGVGIFSVTNAAATLNIRNPLIPAATTVTSGTLTVAGNVVVDPNGVGASTLNVTTGLISIAGNLNVTAAAATNDNGDATASVTNTGRMDVGGNVTVTGGSNNQRDALLTVTGAGGAGQGINITGSLTVNSTVAGSATVSLTNAASRITVGGAMTNNDTVTVGVGALSVSGNYTNNNQAFAVATTVSTGTFTVGGVLTNSATETITISSTGTVNANGGFVNSGTFTNTTTGQLFLRGAANTVNGTFTRGTGTVTMNGAAAQALSGTALFPPTTAGNGFHNLVINSAGGVTLGSNVVARNVITFTSGEVTTGANVLIAEAGCATPSVTRSSGHVIGNFQKLIPAGASTCNFEIGSTGSYTPVSLAFTGATAGRLIARTVAADHPNIGTSGFTVNRTVNRYWTLTTTGVTGVALSAFTNYGSTFTFINPGDLDAGVDPLIFETRRWTGAAWAVTTTGIRTATTTQATGITALGDFAIGEGGVTPPGSFNAFETATGAGAITGVVRTKRSGVAFSLDVVAILSGAQHSAFTSAVLVDLLGNNSLGVALDGNNCPTTFTVVQSVSPNPTITSGRSTVNFAAVANSWRDVRVRVRWPIAGPTVTSCSTDNFAIRPDAITGFSASHTNRTTAGTGITLNSTTFGALLHNAGRPFSVRANAVNGAGSPAVTTNYAGAPVANVTACGPGAGFEACTPTFGGLTLGTTFAAGQLVSDTASYNDVGSFNLQLTDDDFAAVDAGDGSSLAERRIASAVVAVGRFVPDNFAVAFNVPVFAPACTGFTYMGQAFNYSTPPLITVTAREAGGATTTRYAGNWWRLTPATLTPATQAGRYTAASGTLDLSGLPAVAADPVIRYSGDALPAPPAAGTGTFSFSGGTGFRFTRNNAVPTAEFDADIALAVNVVDADGVAYAANPAAFGVATAGNGVLFSDGNALTTNDKRMRYGRLQLGSRSGSQVLTLRIPVEAQFWNGIGFLTNIQDNCTALAAGHVGLSNYQGNLNAGETLATITGSPLSAGRSAIQLSAPGATNHGSVDVTLNLGSGAAADACAGAIPTTAAGNLAHLRGRWCNPPGTYSKDPGARARFGIVSGDDRGTFSKER